MEVFDTNGNFVTKDKFTDKFSGRKDTQLDGKKAFPASALLNAAGAGIYGYQAYDAARTGDAVKAIYGTLGFGKETAEMLAVRVQNRSWPKVFSPEMSASLLAKSARGGWLNFSSLRSDPFAVQFGFGLKMFGAGLDGMNAYKAFQNGDYWSRPWENAMK
jgi:hypothetical protein